jgi:hypothetical protein
VWGSVDVYGAGAANAHATGILGAGERDIVAEIPQQRHVGIAIELAANAIDFEFDHGFLPEIRYRIIQTVCE